MPWPLSSPVHWTTPWRQGESVLLLTPWRADTVLATASEALYPVLTDEQTVWMVAPSARWIQALAAKLAPTRLPFAVLDQQTSVRQAQYTVQRWQAGDLVAVIMDDTWLPTWLDNNANHLADVLLGIDPQTLTIQAEPPLQALWLSPPLRAESARKLEAQLGTSHLTTLPMDPWAAHLTTHSLLSASQINALVDKLSYRGPTFWVSDYVPPPAHCVANAITPAQLPFVLTDGCFILTPDASLSTILQWVTTGHSLSIHQIGRKRAAKVCAWQRLMQWWQGNTVSPVPPCGQCWVCKKPTVYS
jgi:hypothetical protein